MSMFDSCELLEWTLHDSKYIQAVRITGGLWLLWFCRQNYPVGWKFPSANQSMKIEDDAENILLRRSKLNPGTRSLQYLICTNSMYMHWAYHVCRLFILRKTYCNIVQFKGLHLTFISLTAPSWFLCILSVSLLHTVPGPFVVERLSGLLACSLNQKT